MAITRASAKLRPMQYDQPGSTQDHVISHNFSHGNKFLLVVSGVTAAGTLQIKNGRDDTYRDYPGGALFAGSAAVFAMELLAIPGNYRIHFTAGAPVSPYYVTATEIFTQEV